METKNRNSPKKRTVSPGKNKNRKNTKCMMQKDIDQSDLKTTTVVWQASDQLP